MPHDLNRLEEALINADKAGDTQAATVLAKEIRALRNQMNPEWRAEYDPASQEWQDRYGTETTPMIRLGRGMMDVGQGIKQIYLHAKDMVTDGNEADAYTKRVDRELGMYEQGRKNEGDTGVDWWRLGGQVAAASPVGLIPGAGAVTMTPRILSSATQGAIAAGSLFTPEDESKIAQIMTGAAAGGIAPVAIQGVAKGGAKAIEAGRRAVGSVKSLLAGVSDDISRSVGNYLDDIGVNVSALSDDAQKELYSLAKAQLRATGKLDTGAIARKLTAESIGFTDDAALTTGQLTRSPKTFAREVNLSKIEDVGDDLLGRFQNQNRRFMDIKDELLGGIRNKATNVDEVGDSITDAVLGKWHETQSMVGKLYRQAGEKHGDKAVSLKDFVARVDDLSDDLTTSDITGSILKRLDKWGLIDENGATDLKLTLNQAENLRKWIGGLGDKTSNAMRIRGEIIDALDDNVIGDLGDDYFSAARGAARERFNEFGSKVLSKITQQKTAPSKVYDAAIKADPNELAALKKSLTTPAKKGQPPQGEQAWEDMRAQVIESLWEKATARAGRDGKFSGAAFDKAMKTLGDKRLKILFTPEEMRALKATASVGRAVTYAPPYSAVNWSNTTPAAYNLMRQSRILPLIGDTISDAGKAGANRAELASALRGNVYDPAMVSGETQALANLLSRNANRMRLAPAAGLMLNAETR